MAKLYDLNYVKQFCLNKNIELLSKEYINTKQKLICKCIICDYMWNVSFDSLKYGNTKCPKCSKKEQANKYKFSFQFVKQFLFNKNIKLLSEIYENAHQKLQLQCLKCDYMWFGNFNHLRSGRGCPKCAGKAKYKIEEIKQCCFNKNIKLLSEIYENAHQKLQLQCLKCNCVWFAAFHNIKYNNTGCPECGKKNREQTLLKNFGVTTPLKSRIIQEKVKQTMIRKYGVEYSVQNKNLFLKQIKSQNNSTIFYHWKTNEEVVCVASYEKKVVEYLNNNKIDFDWQITFKTPFLRKNGRKRIYIIDLYLKEQDKYVEIKGYMRKIGKQKWEWFHKEHPNSELWDKQKLKELNILT